MSMDIFEDYRDDRVRQQADVAILRRNASRRTVLTIAPEHVLPVANDVPGRPVGPVERPVRVGREALSEALFVAPFVAATIAATYWFVS